MSIQEITPTTDLQTLSTTDRQDQYTLWQILGIWLAAGAPMWLLGWVAYPALSAGLPPVDAGLLRMKLLTTGLIWQFVLAMIILYREEGNIRLDTISSRFWLNHPVSASTGKTKKALWWWIIPLLLLVAFLEIALRSSLIDVWLKIFPFFADPGGNSFEAVFAPEIRAQWIGNWGFLWLFLTLAVFNTFLGEEFIFRGVLLPKMEGVFGKWDWVANGILFSLYHLHQPWGILATLPGDLMFAYSGKRFRSNWFPIILHSGQSVFFLFLILGLVLGLA
ncbi:MAG: CPBP family intramembrane metalloprotease [Caldilineaceae bacterium]|nr:CPBP family intramembrane metalloprotease [Caldilineaceae bacterium]